MKVNEFLNEFMFNNIDDFWKETNKYIALDYKFQKHPNFDFSILKEKNLGIILKVEHRKYPDVEYKHLSAGILTEEIEDNEIFYFIKWLTCSRSSLDKMCKTQIRNMKLKKLNESTL